MANNLVETRDARIAAEAAASKTVIVEHDVRTVRYGIHKGSRNAVMRKALVAARMTTEPVLWEIRWNHPVQGAHTVTLGDNHGPRP